MGLVWHTRATVMRREPGLLRLMGNGPANPAANALVPPELRQDNPTDEENFRQQVVANYTWHGDNQDRIYNEYVKVITG
ncbi:extracellular substrate-binding protein [Bordetella pertussis]|nr:extracellular substrate-binding protein [Bordetella pertussis]